MYQVNTTIDPQRVQDMIIGAFEGGSNYWIERAVLIHPKPEELPEDGVVWWGNSKRNVFAEADFLVKVKPDDESDFFHLGPRQVRDGLEIMARDYGRHFADMIAENDDATTADVFLQCCLFGELVYG
jgi:hypothetical protein